MALSIKNDEAEHLARQLAEETGESLTLAIKSALQERLHRVRSARRQRIVRRQIEDLLTRVDQLPVLDTRPEDKILDYDENGMPRR